MVEIFISGDFCPINRNEKLILEGDFYNVFNDLLPVIKQSDIAVTNLECPLTSDISKNEKSGPNLKASEKAIEALKFAGFNLVTLANNHIMDYGESGLNSTITKCQEAGVDYVGIGSNDQNARMPVYRLINGVTIAFINFCENEWSTAKDNYPGANSLNPVLNYYDITEAKNKADHVIVIVHGGHEDYSLPSPRMKQTYRFFIDAGASVVIGHHTHSFSGYEVYKGSPIFYSLGNFIFDWNGRINSRWNRGFAVQFKIDHKNISYELIPFIQGDKHPGVRLLDESENTLFRNEIFTLNSQISNDEVMSRKFNDLIKARKRNYLSIFEPITNRFFLSLYHRGFLPSFLSARKKKDMLNLIRCESHRDLLINALMNK
jgi:hypothetical protein